MEKKTITTMLQAVDAINTRAKGSKLNEAFVKRVKVAEDFISAKLGTNITQSMVMARFIEHAFEKNIDINTIFADTDSPTSRKLELMNDVEWLVDNKYLKRIKDRWSEVTYRIPEDGVNSLSQEAMKKCHMSNS